MEIIMCENFIIAKRYKSRDFVSFHFVFAVNYVRDKNALYSNHIHVQIVRGCKYMHVQIFNMCSYCTMQNRQLAIHQSFIR